MYKILHIILIFLFSLTMISCSAEDTEGIHEPIRKGGDTINDVLDPVNDVLDPVDDVVNDGIDVLNDGLEEITGGGGDSSDSSATEDISFDPSSVPDNATTVAFGQSYQYQVTTSGTYSGTVTYSLSNEPDNMTISSSGLVQWTPTKAAEITTHSNIKIIITTASGYVLTQTYDLTVTGTCVSGNVLSIWKGDQRSSTDSSKFIKNITAYTDNSSSVKTASQNYGLSGASLNLTHGPTASADKGNIFFYNQYDNISHLYLFWVFGVGGSSTANKVHLDVFTANNESSDNVVESDDSGETNRESQSESSGLYSSTYTGRYKYDDCCSDGGVIGPFSGSTYRIFVDFVGKSSLDSSRNTSAAYDLAASGVDGYDLGTGNLASFTYWSKDGSSFDLSDNESDWYPVDNFTVGYNTTLDCSN